MADNPRDITTIISQTVNALTQPFRSRVHSLSPEIRHVAGLHFGWWDDKKIPCQAPASHKSIRPALALLACEAVGSPGRAALPSAVAVELVHNASLLHDDIIDNDSLRRGRPALWTVKGVPSAILAGDALFFAAVQALTDAPHAERTVPALLTAVQTLIEGEYCDTLLEAETQVSEERIVAVAAGKTGELLACACELGAISGGAEPDRVAHFRDFGRNLGIAFQYVDDLLGIWGREEDTGKPARSDLKSRKATLPVVAAMASRTPEASTLRSLYEQDELTDEDCLRAADLIERTGAKASTLRRARQHTSDALQSLALASPAAVPHAELMAIAHRMTSYSH